jgi:predicted secreted protein
MLWAKIKWTTVIATALFGLFYANYVAGWVVMADIPGWADKGPYRPK